MERIEAESRLPYNHQNNSYDGRKARITDYAENASVNLPGPASPQLEAELALRSDLFRKVTQEYKLQKEITDKQRPNLTPEQNRGLKLIKKRIKEGEYLVLKSDKSNKFVILSREAYIQMGMKHVTEDKELTNSEVTDIQRKITGHTSMLIRILDLG